MLLLIERRKLFIILCCIITQSRSPFKDVQRPIQLISALKDTDLHSEVAVEVLQIERIILVEEFRIMDITDIVKAIDIYEGYRSFITNVKWKLQTNGETVRLLSMLWMKI